MQKVFDEMTSSKGRLIGLDIIRVFAIYYVFVQHGKVLVSESFQNTYSYLVNIPIEGVSVFFLLSGFLIGNILNKELKKDGLSREKLSYFWVRRILRIVPSYLVVLLILYFLNVNTNSFNWYYLFFSQNLLHDQADFFKVSWSLSVEMWFYFLFPVTLFVLLKLFKNRTQALLVTVGVFLVGSLLMRLLNYFSPEVFELETVRKVVFFRLDSVMFGVLASIMYFNYRPQWDKFASLIAVIGVFSLGLMMYVMANASGIISSNTLNSNGFSFENFYCKVNIYYIEALPVLFFLPICTKLRIVRWGIMNKLIVFVSKISYTVYLTHASLVLWFIVPILEKNSFVIEHPQKQMILYIAYILLTLLFSTLLYIVVEKPFTVWRYKISSAADKK